MPRPRQQGLTAPVYLIRMALLHDAQNHGAVDGVCIATLPVSTCNWVNALR
jgi:hypothetical protein